MQENSTYPRSIKSSKCYWSFYGYKSLEKTTSLLIQNWWHLWKCYFQEGIDFAKQILEEHQDVDGIFAITDLVAVGVLSILTIIK
jgi:DNA-binding LacI/PurR family transcriptional regulator